MVSADEKVVQDNASPACSVDNWIGLLSEMALQTGNIYYWNLANQMWVKTHINNEEDCLGYIDRQVGIQPENKDLLQLGLLVSLYHKKEATICVYLEKLLLTVEHDVSEMISILHWILKEASEVEEELLPPVVKVLKNEKFYGKVEMYIVLLKVLVQKNKLSSLIDLLNPRITNNFKDMSEEFKTFISKISYNVALEPIVSMTQRMDLLELTANLADPEFKPLMYLSTVSAGLHVLKSGESKKVEYKLLSLFELLAEMDVSHRGEKALLVYKIVFTLESRSTVFNLRHCLQQLTQFNDEELPLAITVYFMEKGQDGLAVETLVAVVNNNKNSEGCIAGECILEIVAKQPQNWPNILSVFNQVKESVRGKERLLLSFAWNSWVRLTHSDQIVRSEWEKVVITLHNSVSDEIEHIQGRIDKPSPSLYSKILRCFQNLGLEN